MSVGKRRKTALVSRWISKLRFINLLTVIVSLQCTLAFAEGTFFLENVYWAAEMDTDPLHFPNYVMEHADEGGGEMLAFISQDGRCKDTYRILWQFDRPLTVLGLNDSFSATYSINKIANSNCPANLAESTNLDSFGFAKGKAIPDVALMHVQEDHLNFRACGNLNIKGSNNGNETVAQAFPLEENQKQNQFVTNTAITANKADCAFAFFSLKLNSLGKAAESVNFDILYLYYQQ